MANERDYQELFDRLAGLREKVTDIHSADFISNPQLADALMKQIDDLLLAAEKQDQQIAPPADKGLGQLAGVGPDAADHGIEEIGHDIFWAGQSSGRLLDLIHLFHRQDMEFIPISRRVEISFFADIDRPAIRSIHFLIFKLLLQFEQQRRKIPGVTFGGVQTTDGSLGSAFL